MTDRPKPIDETADRDDHDAVNLILAALDDHARGPRRRKILYYALFNSGERREGIEAEIAKLAPRRAT